MAQRSIGARSQSSGARLRHAPRNVTDLGITEQKA